MTLALSDSAAAMVVSAARARTARIAAAMVEKRG